MELWKAELLFGIVTYLTSVVLLIATFRAASRYNQRRFK